MFVILQEQEGLRHWVKIASSSSTSLMAAWTAPPTEMQYAERDIAEHDADTFRARNAREVEATKRRRKYKTEPASYTVVTVEEAARLCD